MELSDFTRSHEDPMTDDRMALLEALQKADDGNFLRSLAETVLQILMEADVEGLIGAGRYERSGERSTFGEVRVLKAGIKDPIAVQRGIAV